MYSEGAINMAIISIEADLHFSKILRNFSPFYRNLVFWNFAILATFWLFLSIFGENLPEVV